MRRLHASRSLGIFEAFAARLRATRWQIPIQHAARPGDARRVGMRPAVLLRGAAHV